MKKSDQDWHVAAWQSGTTAFTDFDYRSCSGDVKFVKGEAGIIGKVKRSSNFFV
jgi:hypothetical protein